MKRAIQWAAVLGAVAVVVLLVRATVFRSKPVTVEIASAERGTVAETVTNSRAGTVQARLRAQIGSERPGRVVEIPKREGSAVRKDDIVLRLDSDTAERQRELAERDVEAGRARLESARAAAELARLERERTERLAASGEFVSQGQLDQLRTRDDAAQAELRAAQAIVERARAALRLAGEEVGEMNVRAPFDGIVAQIFTEVGESIVPGRPLAEVLDPDSLYVSAPIDEVDIDRVRTDLPVRVTIDAFPGVSFEGTLTRVAPFVSDVLGQSRTMEIEVDFHTGGDERPRPGASADVEIILETRDDVLRVPTFAVMDGKRVLVVDDGKAVSRDVSIGLQNWEFTEVVSGLEAGERVVTSLDRPGVKSGARIRTENGAGDSR